VSPPTVTVISTDPALPAGLTVVQLVVEVHVTAVPGVVPKSIVSADAVVEKPVPVMVTVVPPPPAPEDGLIAVTVGAGATKVNTSAALVADVPPTTLTLTSSGPALPAGLTVVQLVVELHVTAVPGVVPKSIVSADAVVEKPVPVMVTVVPPVTAPEVGLMAVTVGAGATKVNTSAALVADVPPTTLTLTSCGPALSGGVVKVHVVVEAQEAFPSIEIPPLKVAVVSVVEKPVPVMVMTVPPAVAPEVGLMAVTVGGAGVILR
jgi:hypothetical protein